MNKQEESFWARVDKTENCWLWNGRTNTAGYGIMGSTIYVHRYSYELTNGRIPAGLEIDHLCKNRSCVNPGHLEAVTHRENLLRSPTLAAVEAAKTHCSAGHEFTEENTYRFRSAPGKRICKACSNPNILRRGAGYKWKLQTTRCKRGHEFTPENTRVYKNQLGNPRRFCKACEVVRINNK